jgi:Flp pilus assembly protein TadD
MGLRLSRDLLRSASRIALAAGAAAFLSGCSGAGLFGSSQPAGAQTIAAFENADSDNQDYAAAAAYWGAKYEANRGDMKAALSFARNLRLMGGARQAVAVLKDVVLKAPDNAQVSSEYGKALTAVGRSRDAIPFLARAIQMDGSDWSTFSAYGVALDQNGTHDAARQNYEIALKLSPANATVESNLAMSYLLSGQVDQAEVILLRLVSRPDATPEMRQNLAMVASLKGNTTEAEQLVRQDLPPDQATNNLTVMRQLDADNIKTPSATEAPKPEAAAPVAAKTAESMIEEAPAAETEDASASTKTAEVATENEVTETAITETSPIVTAGPATPSPAGVSQSRFQMAPIADDADQPKSIVPKGAAVQKPATPTASAAQPAQKQSTMLRKSFDAQAPISIANIAD